MRASRPSSTPGVRGSTIRGTSIFGLQGIGFETFTGDGPISYWNSYVGVSQMGKIRKGGFYHDGRFDPARRGRALRPTLS
jgi:hypothetical protein